MVNPWLYQFSFHESIQHPTMATPFTRLRGAVAKRTKALRPAVMVRIIAKNTPGSCWEFGKC